MLEYIILGLLHEESMSGYDLKKNIDHSIGFFYKSSFGSLYPALKRLEEKEWVSVKNVKGDSKNKKNYTIQNTGKVALFKWLEQPLQTTKNEHLVKIFFIDYLEKDKRLNLLKEFYYHLKNQKSKLQQVEEIVAVQTSQLSNSEEFYHRSSLLNYGVRHLEMEINWLEDLIKRKSNTCK
ncbi:PadR family transcriptional regulator [Bacillus thuringiensis]|nr:PadR family transcriptional regulator [Bacillus thuringiensis]